VSVDRVNRILEELQELGGFSGETVEDLRDWLDELDAMGLGGAKLRTYEGNMPIGKVLDPRESPEFLVILGEAG
tara:strand:- start:1233 stop:1454 length:222 start_codon:yes stop_codon:yes gene_type:complete